MIHKSEAGSFVYDQDSRLDFPVTFEQYVTTAVQNCETLKPQFHRFAESPFLFTSKLILLFYFRELEN